MENHPDESSQSIQDQAAKQKQEGVKPVALGKKDSEVGPKVSNRVSGIPKTIADALNLTPTSIEELKSPDKPKTK